MTLNLRKEDQYWIRENYGKSLLFVSQKSNYDTSAPSLPTRITTHSNKLNKFIKILMASEYVLKVNNFGTKYKSFATAVLGQNNEETEKNNMKIIDKP